ncbi:MAG: hypothetical protein AAB655_02925 [Patescibacteria group bacterium]
MEERKTRVLEAAVESFIETGLPVSSSWLFRHYDFGIKPAMIRLELEDLSDRGYLLQPYHSAGRVPSDKGYEFFAEMILETENFSVAARDDKFSRLFEERAWDEFLGGISSSLGILGVLRDNAEMHKTGLENLIGNLKEETLNDVKSIIRDFAEIDTRIEKLSSGPEELDTPSVFIGRKSPLTKSDKLAIIAGEYDCGENKVFLFAVGPKRMNYRKALRIFKNLNG